jgi:hypothetical protein
MERRNRRRVTVGVFAAVLSVLAIVPSLSLAQSDPIGDLLKGLLGGGGSAPAQGGGTSGDGGSATPQAGSPPNYQPPLHGSNPHGQGTVGTVDLGPVDDAPLPSDPPTSEDVIIGDSQGEQNGDSYHGRVSILYANLLDIVSTDDLGLHDLLTVETNEGETEGGPLDPLNDALDTVCEQSGDVLCANLADVNSSTNANGSENSFSLVDANIAIPGLGAISAGVAESNGNISDDGVCQTATGDSSVASADVLGLTADALNASSTSTACNNGSPSTQTNNSEVINLAGAGIPLPAEGCPGPNETPDTVFSLLVISTVCNADDSNGAGEPTAQTGSPYGVREALTVFLLDLPVPSPLDALLPIKATTAGPESHAVAPTPTTPPENPPTDGPNGGGGSEGEQGGGGGGGGGGNGDGNVGGPAATTAEPGDGQLAFTGTNLIVLALIGAGLVLGGLMLSSTARSHRRAAT